MSGTQKQQTEKSTVYSRSLRMPTNRAWKKRLLTRLKRWRLAAKLSQNQNSFWADG
jgi:hypothetical protein